MSVQLQATRAAEVLTGCTLGPAAWRSTLDAIWVAVAGGTGCQASGANRRRPCCVPTPFDAHAASQCVSSVSWARAAGVPDWDVAAIHKARAAGGMGQGWRKKVLLSSFYKQATW